MPTPLGPPTETKRPASSTACCAWRADGLHWDHEVYGRLFWKAFIGFCFVFVGVYVFFSYFCWYFCWWTCMLLYVFVLSVCFGEASSYSVTRTCLDISSDTELFILTLEDKRFNPPVATLVSSQKALRPLNCRMASPQSQTGAYLV